MAAFGTRNINFVSQENGVLKGKNQPISQNQTKRPALKEVGNRVAQLQARVLAKDANKQEKKSILAPPETKFPVVKHLPAIQVKETKACRLRTQHSRQSIGKIEKKNFNPVPKQDATKTQSSLKSSIPEVDETKDTQELKPVRKLVDSEISSDAIPPKTDDDIKGKVALEQFKETVTQPDVPSAFSSTLLNCAYVVDIDKDDENDPFMLGMYAKDMYKYLREMEVKFPIDPKYFKDSKLNGKMRATLVDWLVEVQREFEMNPETLFLTIAIIDRFLQKNPATNRNKLQLVGITAMFVACKYEEMILPDINEFVYVSDNAYSKREILQMEITMVKALDCSFGRPLPIHFLRRYSKADMVAPLIHIMAKYIMEMGISEYDLCHVAPSLLAAAALYTSLWLLKRKKNVWSTNLVQYSSYKTEDVLPVVKKLCIVLINAETSKLQAVRKKYAHPKNMQVSLLQVLKELPALVEQI